MKKSNKRTPRTTATLIALSIVMGAAVPTTGLGRITVHASEEDPNKVVADATQIGLEEAKQALEEAAKQEGQAAVGAVITVGEGIISGEALGIINEVQASADLDKAEAAINDGKKEVDKALEGFDDDIDDVEEAADAAEEDATKADKAEDTAAEALEEAKEATTSAAAKEQQEVAGEAADAAEGAADEADVEVQNAKTAYAEAELAYNAAVKEAADAKKAAEEAIANAAEDAAEAVEKAEAAEAKVIELKAKVEAAKAEAEDHFTEKEKELADAQAELEAAKDNLNKEVAEEEEARAEVLAATDAAVETGLFLAAAEAYEALSEVTVEGIELAITVMEEAKELAGKALDEAEAALENAEGDKAEAQAAYNAAKAAYDAANATLEQANEDLTVAKAEKDSTEAFAATQYGQDLQKLEKELIDANAAGETETVAQKTQEIIETVIKYDQDSAEAKYDSVALENADNKIYAATDAEGNTTYYQYVANEDGGFSLFECVKNEDSSIVTGTEIVSGMEEAKAAVEGLNDWAYDIVELDNGSYEIVYYDVNDEEGAVTEYTNAEEAEAAKNVAKDGIQKEVQSYEVSDIESKDAFENLISKEAFEVIKNTKRAADAAAKALGIDVDSIPANPVEPEKVEWPDLSDYKTGIISYDWTAYYAQQAAYLKYVDDKAEYDAMVAYNNAKAAYDEQAAKQTAEDDRISALTASYNNGSTLTVMVGEEEVELLCDEKGLYYTDSEGKVVRNLRNKSVKVSTTTTKYRVVEYKVTDTTTYDMVDATADDNYSNVTNMLNAANDKFNAATDDVNAATSTKNAAEADEKAKANELTAAEKELEQTQKVYDTLEELYDAYYGNEEMEFKVPAEVAPLLKNFADASSETLVKILKGFVDLEKLGIDEKDINIQVSDDGQVTIEMPNSSQYDKHMMTLGLAKAAAEDNLEYAREVVKVKKEAHEEALDTLKTETEEYNEAVKELANAAVNVGKAEVGVAGAEVNLAKAAIALDAMKAADAYVTKLQEEVVEAKEAAQAAQDRLDALKESGVNVSADELAAAAQALADAKENVEATEAAAEEARKEAEAARAAYDEIAKIVEALAAKEAAARDDSDDDTDDTYRGPVLTLETGEVVVIEEEAVPMAVTFVEDEEVEVEEVEETEVVVEDVVVEETTEEELVSIDDEQTPLAGNFEEQKGPGMALWFGLGGAGILGFFLLLLARKKKEEEKVEADN